MIDFTLSAFVTLLLVVDPVGLAPAFLAATGGMPDKTKRTIALRAPLIAALGIGIPAFQIAGGLLLFGVSYQMIFGDRPHREAREADKASSEHASDVAVFPLAIPMMAGPGAIATTLLLTGDAGYGPRLAIIIAVVLSVCLLCTLCFIFANMIARSLGRTGNAVLSRVLGMLLAAYSVQFVINGIAAVRASLP
jgi:multiple antibiotic resistance protein